MNNNNYIKEMIDARLLELGLEGYMWDIGEINDNEIQRLMKLELRRKAYEELRANYLNNIWNGEYNEISDTLDCYEKSVIHHGEGIDEGFIFLIDELENYGANDLIESIYDIIKR